MKKNPGGEGEGVEFHTQSMRMAQPVLASVGVKRLISASE